MALKGLIKCVIMNKICIYGDWGMIEATSTLSLLK